MKEQDECQPVLRFKADDPKQQKLGFAISYVCLHGQQYVVTSWCLHCLSTERFATHCDCPQNPQNYSLQNRQ